mgnify:CR=1 FL=1
MRRTLNENQMRISISEQYRQNKRMIKRRLNEQYRQNKRMSKRKGRPTLAVCAGFSLASLIRYRAISTLSVRAHRCRHVRLFCEAREYTAGTENRTQGQCVTTSPRGIQRDPDTVTRKSNMDQHGARHTGRQSPETNHMQPGASRHAHRVAKLRVRLAALDEVPHEREAVGARGAVQRPTAVLLA